MSESDSEQQQSEQPTTETVSAIPDEQLPPDLVPGEDNPLAEGLPDGEGADLLEGGKTAEEMEDPEDEDSQGPAGEHD